MRKRRVLVLNIVTKFTVLKKNTVCPYITYLFRLIMLPIPMPLLSRILFFFQNKNLVNHLGDSYYEVV